LSAWGGSWNGFWGDSWGSIGGRTHAGTNKKKRRRYVLPNGLHVYGTKEEVQVLAQEVFNEPVEVVQTIKPAISIPKMEVTLRAEPVQKVSRPTSDDKWVAFTQVAEIDAITVQKIRETFDRRRRIVKALLLSDTYKMPEKKPEPEKTQPKDPVLMAFEKVAEQMERIVDSINADREIVRDKSGKIVGSRIKEKKNA
jgi:hypothetical protein